MIQDRRVLQAFTSREQQPYMQALESRVSEVEAPDYTLATPAFAIGAEFGNIIRVGVQLRDLKGKPLGYQAVVRTFLSTSVPGTAVAVGGSTVIATAGLILQTEVTRAFWTILTNASGYFDLALNHSAVASYYLNVIQHDRLYTSPPITFT